MRGRELIKIAMLISKLWAGWKTKRKRAIDVAFWYSIIRPASLEGTVCDLFIVSHARTLIGGRVAVSRAGVVFG